MNREPVQSSNVVSVGYDALGEILEIEFKGGAVYQYKQVPLHMYEQLKASESVGSFIAGQIKPNYNCVRM